MVMLDELHARLSLRYPKSEYLYKKIALAARNQHVE